MIMTTCTIMNKNEMLEQYFELNKKMCEKVHAPEVFIDKGFLFNISKK